MSTYIGTHGNSDTTKTFQRGTQIKMTEENNKQTLLNIQAVIQIRILNFIILCFTGLCKEKMGGKCSVFCHEIQIQSSAGEQLCETGKMCCPGELSV